MADSTQAFVCSAPTGAAAIGYSGPIKILGTHAWSSQDSAVSTDPGKFAANGSFSDNLAFADRDKDRTFIESIVVRPDTQPDCRRCGDFT